MKSVILIGSGAVAGALARAVAASPLKLVQVFARNPQQGEALAAACGCDYAGAPSQLGKADLYIMAVSDRAIPKLSSQLDFGGGVVAHTAGSVSIEALSPKIRHRAVLYPLQTFTAGREIDMREVPLLVEGLSPQALECVTGVARALSSTVVEASSARRAKVHLAAVFACNFTNYMYSLGEELIGEAKLPYALLKPLIRETAAKALDAPSPRVVQTGPAARNDYEIRNKHCEMLAEKPEYRNLYTNLSKNIWEISRKTSPASALSSSMSTESSPTEE